MDKITKDIIAALKEGDHKAFETVFVHYFNKVKYFINGLIKSESDAEELAQDVFVKIWRDRASLDTEKNFSTYIYVCARNSTINLLKKKFIRDSFVSEQLHTQSEPMDSEEVYFAKEMDLLIDMAVLRMPERRRTIYELSRKQGFTSDQIATQLDMSKKTVENQMNMTMKELKGIIVAFILLFTGA